MKIEIVQKVTCALVEAMQHLIPQLTDSDINITKEWLKEIVEADGTTFFVAEHDNKIVGALTLVIFRIPTGKKAFIEDVVIDADARGLGIGQKILDVAVNYAQQNEVKKIELSSNPSRIAANALYIKNGFEVRDTNFYRLELK